MIEKKNKTIIIFGLIIGTLILLLVNNKEKSSFRYFIWEIENISIGNLIGISFLSGLTVSSILNKTIINNPTKKFINKEESQRVDNNYSTINEDYEESLEMPPERDVREPQPTISVNYRVIKKNNEEKLKNKMEDRNNAIYEDDWNNKNNEW